MVPTLSLHPPPLGSVCSKEAVLLIFQHCSSFKSLSLSFFFFSVWKCHCWVCLWSQLHVKSTIGSMIVPPVLEKHLPCRMCCSVLSRSFSPIVLKFLTVILPDLWNIPTQFLHTSTGMKLLWLLEHHIPINF